jgi:hypothetical protein
MKKKIETEQAMKFSDLDPRHEIHCGDMLFKIDTDGFLMVYKTEDIDDENGEGWTENRKFVGSGWLHSYSCEKFAVILGQTTKNLKEKEAKRKAEHEAERRLEMKTAKAKTVKRAKTKTAKKTTTKKKAKK